VGVGRGRVLSVSFSRVGPCVWRGVQGWIRIASPVGLGLMKKSLDDEVSVECPDGVAHYVLTGIR